jgi:hypothetical protein
LKSETLGYFENVFLVTDQDELAVHSLEAFDWGWGFKDRYDFDRSWILNDYFRLPLSIREFFRLVFGQPNNTGLLPVDFQ